MGIRVVNSRGDGGDMGVMANEPCEVIEDFSVPEKDPQKKRQNRPSGQSVPKSEKVNSFPTQR